MKILLIILVLLFGLWIFFTWYSVRGLEEPKYTVLEKRDGYEIREYAWYLVAEVTVEWDMRTALNSGFRKLAGYIFWGNTRNSSIAMTTPVLDIVKTSEQIAMTTPVLDTSSSNWNHVIAFTLPSQYTLENLPVPNDTSVTFRQVPKTRRAVLTYSWYATESRVEAKKKLLIQKISIDGILAKGPVISAQYNPPLSFPLLRRNEVMVDIK